MELTHERVVTERGRVRDQAAVVVPLINRVRTDLGELFDVEVGAVTEDRYREEVDRVFADGDLAVNVAALTGLLGDLDVEGDYPGFVVDELLGRELAGTIAGDQPLRLLGEATFHYADLVHPSKRGPDGSPGDGAEAGGAADEGGHLPAVGSGPGPDGSPDGERPAGLDDLDAALAAGFQTRLPGWDWRERESPFGVEP